MAQERHPATPDDLAARLAELEDRVQVLELTTPTRAQVEAIQGGITRLQGLLVEDMLQDRSSQEVEFQVTAEVRERLARLEARRATSLRPAAPPEDPVRLKVREWLALALAAMLLGAGGAVASSCSQGCGSGLQAPGR